MTAGTKRRVRVILEGEAHEVSQRCDLLRVELDKGGEQGGASFLLDPAWPDVTVEDVAPLYVWQDGDVVQNHRCGWTLTRGRSGWVSSMPNVPLGHWTDLTVSDAVSRPVDDISRLAILRHQAGEA